MTLTSRTGAAPLSFLLGGIALVIVIFAFATLGNQAKASADLKTKLDDANGQLASAGLEVNKTLPTVKGASVDLKKTKSFGMKFTGGELSFNYPSKMATKEISEDSSEIATNSDLFGKTSIAKGQLLLKVKRASFNLSTLEEYATRAPYATDHKVFLTGGGLQAMTITNKQGTLVWEQLVVAESPQGPYLIVTGIPKSDTSGDILEMIASTIKYNYETK